MSAGSSADISATGTTPLAAPADAPVLEVADATVVRGGQRVLEDISLSIRAGERVALLGANGSGKSTLLRAIVGVLPLESGRARLFGRPVRDGRAHDAIGYVPQDSAEAGSIPSTARETVATGLLGARRWSARSRDPRVMRALEAVGLPHLADRPITRMSGGQRRRVMIARALVRSPRLLVLDEPFAGVDLPTQEIIAGLFRELAAQGTTLLVVLHETGPLADDLDRVIVLDHGRVIHDGAETAQLPVDSSHDHPALPDAHADCLGQEIHPA